MNKLQDHCFSSDCGWKSYRRIVKIAFFFPEKQFVRKLLLEKIFIFMKSLRSSVEIFFQRIIVGDFFERNLYFHNFVRTWVEKFSKRLSKLNSNIPEEHSWRTFLFKKKQFHNFFSGFGWHFFVRIVITAVDNFRRTFLVKTFVWKNCSFISFLRPSVEKFSAELSKLQSTLPEEHYKRNFFWKKTFISKIFGGLQVKIFPSSCQNCILTYQRNTGGEIVCLEKHKKS